MGRRRNRVANAQTLGMNVDSRNKDEAQVKVRELRE
jgi:ribosomal protein L13E